MWGGRFKFYLVKDEVYLIHLYRYIELDPVRASMVAQPSEYVWSSYQINALGKVSNLCTPHCLYTTLGINHTERQATYRRLLTCHVEGELLEEMRVATQSGMALGNNRFKSELTSLTGRRLHTLPPGRKLGWRKS